MGGSSSSSRDSSYLKVFFRALALVGVISLLFVGSQESVRAKSASPTVTSLSGRLTFKLEDVMGGANLPDHPPELDLNYMSKRRVPNGPDPIHNRYTSPTHTEYTSTADTVHINIVYTLHHIRLRFGFFFIPSEFNK